MTIVSDRQLHVRRWRLRRRRVAQALDSGIPGLRLAAISARDTAKAKQGMSSFAHLVPIVPLKDLAAFADIVVDAAPADALREMAEPACYFGELIAVGMKDHGSVGALVDGGIRDIRWIGALGFPVYARYRTPVQSIGRWKVVEWQQNVYLRGATAKWVLVSPGDFILADEDGAIVIPQAVVSETLGRAEQLTEQSFAWSCRNGLGLEQALAEF